MVYDTAFYDRHVAGSARAAEVIVGRVKALVAPRTVIDVGCGVGAWVKAWSEAGAEAVGCDGDYVDRDLLVCAPEQFHAVDLSEPETLAAVMGERRFDLVMSLEVAEHLDAAVARGFVGALCGCTDMVLFGAAIPGQGGTDHVNEQFPSYWVAIFAAFGFEPFDLLRPLISADTRVPFWYRQNTILFAREGAAWEALYRKALDLGYLREALARPMDVAIRELHMREFETEG